MGHDHPCEHMQHIASDETKTIAVSWVLLLSHLTIWHVLLRNEESYIRTLGRSQTFASPAVVNGCSPRNRTDVHARKIM